MSLREELERAVKCSTGNVIPADDWENLCTSLIRDHGQALLDALEDGARGKWVIDHAAWIRRDGQTFMEIKLPAGVNLSSYGLRRDAIDAAIKGEEW